MICESSNGDVRDVDDWWCVWMVVCVDVDDWWCVLMTGGVYRWWGVLMLMTCGCVCVQMRTQESLKVPQLDIAVPMHLRGKNKKAGKAGFGEPSGLKRRL